mgnify:CR=1 FL=1
MYFCDKNGLVWKQEGEVFRNVGISVKEKTVTFKKLETVKVDLGTITVPELKEAVPVSLRQAVSKLKITEDTPLKALKNLKNLEV